MRSIFDLNIVRMMFVVLAALITLHGQQALAADHIGALDAQVSLATKTTFVQGEPIILRYSTVNVSDQKLGVSWGQTAGYTVSLTDQARATTFVQQQDVPTKGFYLVPDPLVPAGSKRETYFVVPQRVSGLYPGRYILTVQVRLGYTTVESSEENPLEVEKEIKASGNVLNRVFRFPLTVKAPNDSVLRTAAASLLKSISAHPYGDLSGALTTALFSMPETAAAASWRVLVDKPGMSSGLYASELKRLQTPTAADMLARMLSDSTLSSDDKAYIAQCLNGIYNKGNPAVKEHIKSIAAQRGVQLPEQVTVPLPAD